MGDEAPSEKKEESVELNKAEGGQAAAAGGGQAAGGEKADAGDDPNNPSCCCCSAGAPEPNALGSNSIVERSRICTDPHMFLIFIAFCGGMCLVADLAFKQGDPDRVMYGTNWQGKTCNAGDLKGYDAQFWANPFYYQEMGALCLSPEVMNTSDGCPHLFPWDTPGKIQVVCYCNTHLYEEGEHSLHDPNVVHPVIDPNTVVGNKCMSKYGEQAAIMGGAPINTTGFFMTYLHLNPMDAMEADGTNLLNFDSDINSTYLFAWDKYLPQASSSGMYMSTEACIPAEGSVDPHSDPAYPACAYLRRAVPICNPTYKSVKQFNRCVPQVEFSDVLNLFGAKACGGKGLNDTDLGEVDPNASEDDQKSFCSEDKMSELFNGINEWATGVFADLERCWDIIAAMCGGAVVLGFVYLITMRYCACFLIWTTMLAVLASLALLTTGFYWYYAKVLERVDITPQLETHETDVRNGKILLAFTIIFGILTAVQLALIVFFARQINVAAKVLMCAAEALIDMPYLLIYPLFNCVMVLVFFVGWCSVSMFLYSAGDDSWSEEWGTHEYTYNKDMKRAIIYWIFGFFWVTEFIAAIGFVILAFCVAMWFFAPRPEGVDAESDEREMPSCMLAKAIKMTLCHHLGTIATGSLIIAIVQMLKVALEYADQKKKELGLSDNAIVKFIFGILKCCLWCLEKCVRWLNKHVYIQMVISGCWFCTGICRVARALLANLSYIAMCSYVSTFMLLFGKLAISLGTAAIGVMICDTRELTSVIVPGFIMMMIGFVVAVMFCEVYELVIDTMLMCFCEAKMNATGGCIPKALESFMDEGYHNAKEAAVIENNAAGVVANPGDHVGVQSNGVPSELQDLSPALLTEMKTKFERYDLDGSNTINSSEELQQLMVNLYFAISAQGAEAISPDAISDRVKDAGDMEANCWTFNQWASWLKSSFPEIARWQGPS